MKKILDNQAKQRILSRYTNDSSLATVQAKRIDNYSAELAKCLE